MTLRLLRGHILFEGIETQLKNLGKFSSRGMMNITKANEVTEWM